VDVGERKIQMWVPAWRRMVSVRTPLAGWSFEPREGARLQGTIHVDANGRNWKQRIVYSLSAVGGQN